MQIFYQGGCLGAQWWSELSQEGMIQATHQTCDEAPRSKPRRQHQWHSGTPLQTTSCECLETSWQGNGQGAASLSNTAWELDHAQWYKAQARSKRQPQDLRRLLKSGLHAVDRLRKEARRSPEGATWPHKASAEARKKLKEEGPRNMGAEGGKSPTDGTLSTVMDTQLPCVGQSKKRTRNGAWSTGNTP